jgi:VWFA-related protein
VRTVTLPISIFTKQELREDQAAEFVRADRLTVREAREEQQILSIRSVSNTPLALAILVQDDLSTNFNLQLRDLAEFIRRLPRGTRVMVGYVRSGSLQIRQRFTDDLDRAASSLRIASGANSGNGVYGALTTALRRFDALPAGRRAVLLISDGVDTTGGSGSRSDQSIDFERAVDRAQLHGVAVYTIFSPTGLTANPNSRLTGDGQGALQKLADETGGRAFFQGTSAPTSFMPFIRDLNILLNRQFALTYLSTHMKKGYYKVDVTSSNPEVKIEHPKGYYYR